MAKATVPGTTIGLLTVTSKMPCDSFSIPAGRACPGAFYGEAGRANVDKGTICGSCYASKGMYAWPAVAAAQEARFQWLLGLQRDGEAGLTTFVETMVPAIRKSVSRQKTDQKYFRVHDSGDLFSVWYVRAWHAVASAMPDVSFWIPTRSWRMKSPAMQEALRSLAALPNVALRPSALFFSAPAPRIEGFSAGTTAAEAGFTCPASSQGNQCGDCRACWDPTVEISYRKH